MTLQKFLIPVLALAAACVPVSATPIIYCSNGCSPDTTAAFTTATASLFFPNAPILFTTAGLSADTTTYTDAISGAEFLDLNSSGSSVGVEGFNSPIGTGLQLFTQGDVIEVSLPANVYAFATNLEVSSTSGGVCVETASTFTHSCSGDDVFLPSANTPGFVGVASASPITTVWLASSSSSQLQLDNFEIGEQQQVQVSDTPEVATMLMIGAGLISLGVMRRAAVR